MSSRVIQLSSQGLERATSSSDNDFTFIINGIEIQCTQFEASFISPRVGLLVQQDKTIKSFFVESLSLSRMEGIELNRILEHFELLMKGSGIVGSGSEMRGLCEFGAVLGNTELLKQFCDSQEINAENVCSRLKNDDYCEGFLEEAIGFAASHFYELQFEELKDLDICILDQILSSPLLRLKDEDSLLEFICEVDSDSRILARQVFSEYLSCENMSVFLDFVSGLNPDPMIWSSLCRRLLLPVWHPSNKVEISKKGSTSQNRVEIQMKEAKSLDGIISYLTQKHGGNVHENGIVTITSKSVYDPGYGDRVYYPFRAADLTSDTFFYTPDEPGQWICWDFGEMRVRPTHYTIRTCSLKSWVVECSLDGSSWMEIDRQTGNGNFKSDWNTASFTVSNPTESRLIRLTQTEKNNSDDNYLPLVAVEFFGILSQ
jgi:hypothetical protein